MTLGEARCKFSVCVAYLLLRMNETPGYRAAYAEGLDRRTSKDPTSDHLAGGLHDIGLGQDIDLYRLVNGEWTWCTETSDHEQFGLYWEDLGEKNELPLRWGGRWQDGNHYSHEWRGVK